MCINKVRLTLTFFIKLFDTTSLNCISHGAMAVCARRVVVVFCAHVNKPRPLLKGVRGAT